MDAVAAPADLPACGESSPGRGVDGPPPGPDADPDAVRLVEPSPSLLERCGVCKGWLRERQPRLLPCLHSVCKGCLHGALNADSSPQTEGLISCPVCRQQCYIKDIIENYFLRDTGEADTSSNKKVCTSCEDNAVSSSFCVECAEWLCDACVEAHQRVKFTKDHTMSKKNPGLTVDGRISCERPIFCSIHRQETLKLFCETCDTLTCRDCQLLTHKDHRYQFLEEAIKNQKMTLENLVKRLTEKKTQLQVTTKQVRNRLRDVQDMQKKVQVEIKMAILQIMRELNKRGKTLIQRVERLAEEQQLKLEQQHLSMSKLYRQMDHVLKFASWAVNTDNSTALLLCKKLIFYQLQRGLQSKVNTEELKNDIITFLWDSAFWTKNAANFGNVVIEVPPTLSTHVPVQHPSVSSHCPQPVSQQHPIPQLQPVSQHQPNNRMIATQGNSWQSHAPMQSSHRLPPPSYQQTQLPPPRQLPPQQNTQQVLIRQPHSAPHWSPVSGHSRMQQAVQLVKPKTTMPSTNGRYLQQMQVQVVQQGNIVQMQQQQQQQQQLMNQVLLLPQMNGVQIRQPQGHTQGAVKQSIIGGQTLYQQMSVHQPTAISKLPSPTQRQQQLSFGPSAAGSVQSPPSHHLSTSSGLSNVPVSRPSPPVQQALRSNTSTSRQLLTTATPQQVHSNNSATSQSTQVGANCHRSPTSSNRLGNSPVDQLKLLVQQATSYPRVILPHRDGPANAHDFAQKQYAYPGPSLVPQQVGRDDSLLYSLILTSDGALAWSDSGAEGFVKEHSTCHVSPAFSEPRRGVSFKLSNVSTTTEQEEQRNNIKELQEASESRCMPLQCTVKHTGDSSGSNVKPKLNRKVPYVRLERLQIDLSTDTELPTFKLLPGSGQDEFNLIVIEGNGLPINPTFTAPTLASTLTPPNSVSPASVTEIEFVFNERTEVASKRTHHTLSPTPSPSEKSPGSIVDLKASPLCSASEKGEEADEVVCVVCGKGGELPCCSRCLKVFHIGCHVPALLSMPSVEWTCSLCVDLATSEVESESSTTLADSRNEVKEGLAALDQKKCERLLLFLLSHKMSQALHNPSGSSQLKSQQFDLSSIRAKLDRASSPHYSSPDEFVLEARLMFKAFSKLSQEKKEVAESVLTLESFFEEKLADVFSGKAFASTPADDQAMEAASKHCDQTDQRDPACPSDEADGSPVQAKRRRLESE